MKFKTQQLGNGPVSPRTLLAQAMELDMSGVLIVGIMKESESKHGLSIAMTGMDSRDVSLAATHVTLVSLKMAESSDVGPIEGPGHD